MAPPVLDLSARFLHHINVEEQSIPYLVDGMDPGSGSEVAGPCWMWTGHPAAKYPQMRVGGRKGRMVHVYRIAYEEMVGAIPGGHEIDHLCSVPRCVNPDHLEACSSAENHRRRSVRRMSLPFCGRGHPISGPEAFNSKGTCRSCALEHSRIHRVGLT